MDWNVFLLGTAVSIGFSEKGALQRLAEERVVRTMKEEWLDWRKMPSFQQFKQEVERFVSWYNNEREHSALKYKVPMEVYESVD